LAAFEFLDRGKIDQLRMKAIIIEGGGGPEVLKLKEVDVPIAGEGEVLIKVAAAALNQQMSCSGRGTILLLRALR
jgi:hypothetical protein